MSIAVRRAIFSWILTGVVWIGVAQAPAAEAEGERPRLVVQTGHTAQVEAVAFSADGKWALTGARNGLVCLWEASSGRKLRDLEWHGGQVLSVGFGPDGKTFRTAANDRTVAFWNTETGEMVRAVELTGQGGALTSAAFSADGKRILTGSDDSTAFLWNTDTGEKLLALEGHTGAVIAAAFSPDGNRVVTGSRDFSASLWDTKTGRRERSFKPGGVVFSTAFSPDGKQVLVGSIGGPIIWNAESGEKVRSFEGDYGYGCAVAFSPDGQRVLRGSGNYNVEIWETATGKKLRQFKESNSVMAAAFSPDGKRVLTGTFDNTAAVWDADTGTRLHGLGGQTGIVSSVAFDPRGERVLIGSHNRTASLWDVTTGGLVRTFKSECLFESVAFSPDGKQILTGLSDSSAVLWDPSTGKELRTYKGFGTPAAFSPDGKWVLLGSALYDAATGKELRRFAPGSYVIGRDETRVLIGGAEDNAVRLWDASTGKKLCDLAGHTSPVGALALSPDGKRVLTGYQDHTARLWDASNGKSLHTLEGHASVIQSVAFSPDGTRMVTGAWKSAVLWDADSGEQLDSFDGHSDWVRSVVFSPNGKYVLTGSEDGTTRLWDAATCEELCRLAEFRDGSWAVVDPEGRYDAGNGGDVEGLHWVVGLEPIALNQLKERYYDPGLLAKHLGFSKEPLRPVAAFMAPKLHPEAVVREIKPGDKRLTIDVTNRGGGIGRVQVLVNGKELTADARGPKPDPDAPKATLTVDLSAVQLISGKPNKIEVVTWNADGYLASRGLVREIDGPTETVEAPELYAIVAGVSTYGNPALNLRFAAKDAEDFATALQVGGKRFFGADKVHLTLLTTSDHPQAVRPTKDNLKKAFDAARKSKPGDVLVVYLAGHGVALQRGSDLYCYLTTDARSLDPAALADPAVRAATTVSSEELAEWIKQIPALKQVMVLDTCAAGAAATKLTEKRDVSGDQVRAIERLKDRTGFHVLMGCAADRVSYEATQYAQGLLTYALLQGMRGAALRDEQFVDVSKLFQYAADRVPELSRNIGGVQRPLVAAPRGTSFDVGRLEADDRARVPLALVKPLVLRPSLLNRDEDEDNLKLTALLRQRLSEASQSVARGQEPAIVYVPEDEFPGAVRATGTYAVEGDKVSVRLTLKRDGAVVTKLTVEGGKADLPALAEKMAQAVLGAAR